MIQILQMFLFVAVGALLAVITGTHNLEDTSWYMFLTGSLLAIGLYASTYSIALSEARQHFKIIISAVTIGVLLKALFIGGSLALITGDPFMFILGVIVAQIDPLSVSRLMKGSRLSKRAKAILGSWASFDDPITVILALYAPAVVASMSGTEWRSITDATNANAGLISYGVELMKNIGFVASIFVIWILLKKYIQHSVALGSTILALGVYALLGLSLSVSVYYFWMLSVAITGLFLRPDIDHIIEQATKWALWLATILLGFLLIDGITVKIGLMLGVAAYVSQIIVGMLLTHGLSRQDRLHIAFAQQNGITAIILSLLFEPIYPGTVSIVAPAIVVINLLHVGANKFIDTHVLREKA